MLTALGLALLGGVLVVDVGLLLDERRQAQGAADFAALAAAQDLPRSDLDPDLVTKIAAAEGIAHDYLDWNGYEEAEPDVTHIVNTTYTGDVDKIEVIVRRSRSWIFGRLFGLGDITVQGRAVAAANALQRDVVVTLDRSGSMCIDSHGSLMLNCGAINYTSSSAGTAGSTPNPLTGNISTDPDDLVVVGATAGNAGSYVANNGFTLQVSQSVGGTMTFATATKPSAGGGETYSMTHSGPNRQQLVAVTLPSSGAAVTQLGAWDTGLLNYVAPAGSDRLLVFVAGFEDSGSPDLNYVRYGGQDLRLLEKDDIGSTEAGVEIWVLDETGIQAASGDDFVVSWDESVAQVAYAGAFFANVNQGYEPFDTMREAADEFSENFTPFLEGVPFDELALVSYSTSASLDLGLTTDYGPGSAFSSTLWSLAPAGYTNIGHAIAVARQELEANSVQGEARVIVLLSDGEPNRYRTGGTDASPTFATCSSTPCTEAENYARDEAEIAAAAGIAIYTIGLSERAGEDLLRDLAQIGAAQGAGGQYFDVDDPSDLNDTFTQIADLLNFALIE
jgi:hypothetical protein